MDPVQPAQTSQRELNDLFANIIDDLVDDIVQETRIASEETLRLASEFLDDQSRRLITDVQRLFDRGREDDACPADVSTVDRPIATQAIARTDGDLVGHIHAGIRELARKNSAVRTEIGVVLSSMQFTEMLRQHLEGVRRSFRVLTNNPDRTLNQLCQALVAEMHTYDERRALYEHVLHEDLPHGDADMSQQIIDQLIG